MKLPPRDWWRTWLLLAPAITFYTVAFGTVSLLSTLVDRRGRAAHACARQWARLILWTSGVRVRVHGAPLPPADASCVFAANHQSFYDIPLLFWTLPGQVRIPAKASLGRVPFIGWHLKLAGHLLVDRAQPGPGIVKRMRQLVAHGASLIAFPEGTRTRDGRVGRFKAGVFALAVDAGLPVVPLTIAGSREVMPRGRVVVHPGVIHLTVHPAVDTAGLSRDDVRALAARVHDVVAGAVGQPS